MNDEVVIIIKESVEGGFEAKALGYSIFTEGETLEETKEAAVDAVRCHLDSQTPRVVFRYL